MVDRAVPVARRPIGSVRVGTLAGSCVLVIVCALLLYVPTLPPTVLWGGGDFARFQVWAYTLHLEGGDWGHPLWVLLAHPFTLLPIGDVAYRSSLATAVMAAVALALVFTVIYDLTLSRLGAWFGTAVLAVSHTFWTYAVMPKVYALNVLLLALALLCAIRWERTHRPAYLYGLAIAFGLGAFAHPLFFALAPAFAVYILLALRGRDIVHLIGALALYGAMAIVAVVALPYHDATGAIGGTALGFVHQFLTVIRSPRSLALGLGVFVALVVYQFFVTLGIAVLGGRMVWRVQRRVAVLFVLIVLLDVAFLLAWLPTTPRLSDYAQNWHFYLPAYVVIAILAGIGIGRLAERFQRAGNWRLPALVIGAIALPVVVYAAAPHLARGAIARFGIRTLPGRDNATYLLSPWKMGERGARTYGQEVLQVLPRNATLLADYSIYWVVDYLHEVEGRRPDVRLVELPSPPAVDQQPAIVQREARLGRPLFIADTNSYYDIADFSRLYRIVPYHLIYQLVPRHAVARHG